MKLSFSTRILIGRLLTRSGDQAWDFAVPLVLIKILPGEFRIAALYYFLVRLATVVFLPRLTSLIDTVNRFKAAKLGILLQLVGVILGLLSLYLFVFFNSVEPMWGPTPIYLAFAFLIFGGILSNLGSSFMDISIANDLVPSSFTEDELARFNSRLRQVDLFTEVTAPVIAGLLLVLEWNNISLFGFLLIGIWNILSFLPEYGILRSIFHDRPELMNKPIQSSEASKTSFIKKITKGWRSFFKEPVALAVLAYAVLWLSALSPHGVLLTAFLIDGWKLPEWEIGIFRGLGAFFGLGATVLFPKIIERWGLLRGTQGFVVFQFVMVLLALICFLSGDRLGQIGFLAFVLFSRIGVYGFGLGEIQIRQIGIRPEVRGQVNGFASALTGIATLGLYAAGALLPSTQDFNMLIIGSVLCVLLSAIIYSVWAQKHSEFKDEFPRPESNI
ncbi:MAG: hypothetical protein B7Y39_04330 [Bdellovibrio sp. 28-41-41]|nr:MAG: hypothetical protein B7Y39_04330 [Bdellovibrio sp. 28-41-41]